MKNFQVSVVEVKKEDVLRAVKLVEQRKPTMKEADFEKIYRQLKCVKRRAQLHKWATVSIDVFFPDDISSEVIVNESGFVVTKYCLSVSQLLFFAQLCRTGSIQHVVDRRTHESTTDDAMVLSYIRTVGFSFFNITYGMDSLGTDTYDIFSCQWPKALPGRVIEL